ncbi:MAG: hypothetical protein R3D27_12955 [Hyphomicrobiaceae bacterium]
MRFSFKGWIAAATVAATFAGGAAVAQANVLANFPGRWTGWGSVSLESGESEKVKCVATYFVENGQSDLRQNLRCASASYKIDVLANLKVAGNAVSGMWQERTNASKGPVTGRIDGNGINVSVKGETFTATMAITTTTCRQSIKIAPKGLGIKRISIDLGKC